MSCLDCETKRRKDKYYEDALILRGTLSGDGLDKLDRCSGAVNQVNSLSRPPLFKTFLGYRRLVSSSRGLRTLIEWLPVYADE